MTRQSIIDDLLTPDSFSLALVTLISVMPDGNSDLSKIAGEQIDDYINDPDYADTLALYATEIANDDYPAGIYEGAIAEMVEYIKEYLTTP